MKTNNNGNNATEIKSFIEFCKAQVIDNLADYEGQDVYACDLAYTLTERMNADGTFTYNRAEAKEYIKEWWDTAADYSDYEEFNFGKRSNPFENPEAFTVCMVINGVSGLLAKCAIIDEKWNDRIELTAENIATIKEQIEELSDDTEVF